MSNYSDSSCYLGKYKVVVLGEQSVGKTSVITRFMYDRFDQCYDATIGLDFISKTMFLEDRAVRLQLWDTAGQERFRSLMPSYIRDSSIAMVVYDVTCVNTFQRITSWVEEVKIERGVDAVILIVGNKSDMEEKRQVSFADGQNMAKELKVLFMETSAKTGYNIRKLFRCAVAALPENDNVVQRDLTEIVLREPEKNVPESNCAC